MARREPGRVNNMSLTSAEEQWVISLLRKEKRDKIEKVLRTVAALMNWLADAIGIAADLYRRIRKAASEFWQDLRSIFT